MLTDEEIENFKDPYENSQGFKKLWNYFLHIIETKDFQDDVRLIREKFNIDPKNKKPKEMGVKYTKLFFNSMNDLAFKYGLDPATWWTSLAPYISYNEIIEPQDTDMCFLSDNINEPCWTKESIDTYPVIIRISPYASRRDIEDYINRFYPFISATQKQYQHENFKIGKFKNKKDSIKERNNFIYEHRDLPRKEIMKLVVDKFGTSEIIEYGYIGKIISMEKKKRKDA